MFAQRRLSLILRGTDVFLRPTGRTSPFCSYGFQLLGERERERVCVLFILLLFTEEMVYLQFFLFDWGHGCNSIDYLKF